jgi:hypothetical protein
LIFFAEGREGKMPGNGGYRYACLPSRVAAGDIFIVSLTAITVINKGSY